MRRIARSLALPPTNGSPSSIGVAEIKLENGDLEKGQTLLITGPTTGVIEFAAGEIRVDLKETEKAMKGEYCSLATPEPVRRSDKVFLWVDALERHRQ